MLVTMCRDARDWWTINSILFEVSELEGEKIKQGGVCVFRVSSGKEKGKVGLSMSMT